MPQSSEKKSSVMETSMIRDFARRVIDDFGDQTDSYGVGLWKAVASEIERIRIPEANVPRSRH